MEPGTFDTWLHFIVLSRFFAICFPMKVKTICTTRRAKIVIPGLWLAAILCALPEYFTKVIFFWNLFSFSLRSIFSICSFVCAPMLTLCNLELKIDTSVWNQVNTYLFCQACKVHDNRGFPKVDHSGIGARIVLEQINSANKTTSNRTGTLNPRTVYTAHFLSLMPNPLSSSKSKNQLSMTT